MPSTNSSSESQAQVQAQVPESQVQGQAPVPRVQAQGQVPDFCAFSVQGQVQVQALTCMVAVRQKVVDATIYSFITM